MATNKPRFTAAGSESKEKRSSSKEASKMSKQEAIYSEFDYPLSPEDLAAIENGIKVLRSELNGKT